MTHEGHFIEVCKVCGEVICQCRCMSRDKKKTLGVCEKCKEKAKKPVEIGEIYFDEAALVDAVVRIIKESVHPAGAARSIVDYFKRSGYYWRGKS